MVISWLQNQRERALFFWSISNLVSTVAMLCFFLRGNVSEIITVHLANILLILGAAIAWAGMRIFVGKNWTMSAILICPAIWLVCAFFPAFSNSILARAILSSTVVSAFAFAVAFELFAQRREKIVSRYPAIAASLLHGAFILARVPALVVSGCQF